MIPNAPKVITVNLYDHSSGRESVLHSVAGTSRLNIKALVMNDLIDEPGEVVVSSGLLQKVMNLRVLKMGSRLRLSIPAQATFHSEAKGEVLTQVRPVLDLVF